MAPNRPYPRNNRSRSTPRGEPPADAVAVALTVQVLVCILLLLLTVLAKKADETRYVETKQQFHLMVTDPAESAELFDSLTEGGLGQIFAGIEAWITSLVDRFTGERSPEPVAEVEPKAVPEDDAGVDEPEDEAPALPTLEFDYNYLSDGEESSEPWQKESVAAGFSGGFADLPPKLGQGGAFPVQTAGDTSRLPPPEEATYRPVMVSQRLVPPVTGVITSEFSYRDHPVTGEGDFHNGIDIAAAAGRDIAAALPGRVVEVGEDEIYGKYVTLQHASNFRTFYAHCSQIIAREGMAVRQGERIAKVGDTGVTTGPHLHFAVIVDDLFTNPYWVLQDNIKPVQ